LGRRGKEVAVKTLPPEDATSYSLHSSSVFKLLETFSKKVPKEVFILQRNFSSAALLPQVELKHRFSLLSVTLRRRTKLLIAWLFLCL